MHSHLYQQETSYFSGFQHFPILHFIYWVCPRKEVMRGKSGTENEDRAEKLQIH